MVSNQLTKFIYNKSYSHNMLQALTTNRPTVLLTTCSCTPVDRSAKAN